MNQSLVFPETGAGVPGPTYCACRVEDFQHALLPVHLHLLQQREEKGGGGGSVLISGQWLRPRPFSANRRRTHLPVRVFYCGVVLFHEDSLHELNCLQERTQRDGGGVRSMRRRQGRSEPREDGRAPLSQQLLRRFHAYAGTLNSLVRKYTEPAANHNHANRSCETTRASY